MVSVSPDLEKKILGILHRKITARDLPIRPEFISHLFLMYLADHANPFAVIKEIASGLGLVEDDSHSWNLREELPSEFPQKAPTVITGREVHAETPWDKNRRLNIFREDN